MRFVASLSELVAMDIIGGGNQILCYLKVELLKDLSINNMCMSNIRYVNSKGEFLNNYNSSLTFYGE